MIDNSVITDIRRIMTGDELCNIHASLSGENIDKTFTTFKHLANEAIKVNHHYIKRLQRNISVLDRKIKETRDDPRGVLGDEYHKWKDLVRDFVKLRLDTLEDIKYRTNCGVLDNSIHDIKDILTIIIVVDEIEKEVENMDINEVSFEEIRGLIEKTKHLNGRYREDKHSRIDLKRCVENLLRYKRKVKTNNMSEKEEFKEAMKKVDIKETERKKIEDTEEVQNLRRLRDEAQRKANEYQKMIDEKIMECHKVPDIVGKYVKICPNKYDTNMHNIFGLVSNVERMYSGIYITFSRLFDANDWGTDGITVENSLNNRGYWDVPWDNIDDSLVILTEEQYLEEVDKVISKLKDGIK